MKILLVDIETTGFSHESDTILEIGIVSLDLETGETVTLFDSPVLEPHFCEKHKNAWIFSNSDLTLADIASAPTLEEVFPIVQEIFDTYEGITAYNRSFDFGFLESRCFELPRALPCPMLLSTDVIKLPKKNGAGYKLPKAQEAWDFYFPETPYVEKHRGADDARIEALIVHEMFKRGIFKTETLTEVVEKLAERVSE